MYERKEGGGRKGGKGEGEEDRFGGTPLLFFMIGPPSHEAMKNTFPTLKYQNYRSGRSDMKKKERKKEKGSLFCTIPPPPPPQSRPGWSGLDGCPDRVKGRAG